MLPMELKGKLIDNITELRKEPPDLFELSGLDKIGYEICPHVN